MASSSKSVYDDFIEKIKQFNKDNNSNKTFESWDHLSSLGNSPSTYETFETDDTADIKKVALENLPDPLKGVAAKLDATYAAQSGQENLLKQEYENLKSLEDQKAELEKANEKLKDDLSKMTEGEANYEKTNYDLQTNLNEIEDLEKQIKSTEKSIELKSDVNDILKEDLLKGIEDAQKAVTRYNYDNSKIEPKAPEVEPVIDEETYLEKINEAKQTFDSQYDSLDSQMKAYLESDQPYIEGDELKLQDIEDSVLNAETEIFKVEDLLKDANTDNERETKMAVSEAPEMEALELNFGDDIDTGYEKLTAIEEVLEEVIEQKNITKERLHEILDTLKQSVYSLKEELKKRDDAKLLEATTQVDNYLEPILAYIEDGFISDLESYAEEDYQTIMNNIGERVKKGGYNSESVKIDDNGDIDFEKNKNHPKGNHEIEDDGFKDFFQRVVKWNTGHSNEHNTKDFNGEYESEPSERIDLTKGEFWKDIGKGILVQEAQVLLDLCGPAATILNQLLKSISFDAVKKTYEKDHPNFVDDSELGNHNNEFKKSEIFDFSGEGTLFPDGAMHMVNFPIFSNMYNVMFQIQYRIIDEGWKKTFIGDSDSKWEKFKQIALEVEKLTEVQALSKLMSQEMNVRLEGITIPSYQQEVKERHRTNRSIKKGVMHADRETKHSLDFILDDDDDVCNFICNCLANYFRPSQTRPVSLNIIVSPHQYEKSDNFFGRTFVFKNVKFYTHKVINNFEKSADAKKAKFDFVCQTVYSYQAMTTPDIDLELNLG